jgi:CRP-like cAMP-binding protein
MAEDSPRLLRRLLAIRQFPLLAVAGLDELATVAENLQESYFPPGSIVARESSRMTGIQLVVDGCIEANGHNWQAREVFGALEVFAGRPCNATAIAKVATRTLELPASDVSELLEDNFGLMLSSLRELTRRMLRLKAAPPRVSEPTRGPLGLVERLILLRQHQPFAVARLQALAMLANNSDELHWPRGVEIVHEGEPATDGYIIIDGALRTSRGDTIGPGVQVGQLETLAGAQYASTIETTSDVRALRSSGTAVIDMLEDHTDIGLAMIASFARALLDGSAQLN